MQIALPCLQAILAWYADELGHTKVQSSADSAQAILSPLGKMALQTLKAGKAKSKQGCQPRVCTHLPEVPPIFPCLSSKVAAQNGVLKEIRCARDHLISKYNSHNDNIRAYSANNLHLVCQKVMMRRSG